ncbi:MAG: hypothetical protein K2U26_00615, partial [Cyclobacteriaceae bacterium]|nr:hypothetical protein [Cyclobacteriaceae bacterium]
ALFEGQNRPNGAMISYIINKPEEKPEVKTDEKKADDKGKKAEAKKEDKPAADKKPEEKKDEKPKIKYDSLTLEVFNMKGDKIRTVKVKAPEDNGFNRMTWGMNEKGERQPSREKARPNAPEPGGPQVLPGAYKVRLTFGNQKDSTMITVKSDPRFQNMGPILESRYAMLKDLQKMTGLATQATERLRESKEIADEYEKKIKEAKRDDLKEAGEKTKAIKDSVNAVLDYILGKEDKRQGIVRSPDPTPVSYIGTAQFFIGSSKDPVGTTDQRVFKQAEDQTRHVLDRVNAFYEKQWPAYRTAMEKVSISPFKNYEPLKRN